MTKPLARNSETFQALWAYMYGSLGIIVTKVTYAGTHSNEGLTPIVHYDIEYQRDFKTIETPVRATVYWNNATEPPTITRMDVI